ncbi:MAG: hypothetical protein J2P25_19090, partial [Nocardiopsaceae bacterium]|nr:hypothetical protein [Nocardiopsaceae bacterium]
AGRGWALAGRWAPRLPVLAAAAVFLTVVAPQWLGSLRASSSVRGFAQQDAAVAWVARHVPAGDLVVCDDYPWVDIKTRTRAVPVSLWQIDNDPSVMRLLHNGYQNISYLVLDPTSPLMADANPGRPTLREAVSHSRIIRRFGPIRIYKVRHRRAAGR